MSYPYKRKEVPKPFLAQDEKEKTSYSLK